MGDSVTTLVRSIAHGITNQATTEMIAARAAITMIAHRVTQICQWHALSLHVPAQEP
jgi:hypothetical protein